MGRKALLAVFNWLVFSNISAKEVQTAAGAGLIDNISEESVSRLYHKVPVGVYASATPYAAYSFHVPQFVAPKSNQVIPVKEESIVAQSTNGFLKDSYGQTFVGSPQAFAYKSTFPQQFVPLQNLPAHLSQPLVAAAPNTQYGRTTPHFFGSAPFKLGNLQSFSTNPLGQFSIPQSLIYADNVRTLTAAPALNRQVNDPVTQQQSAKKNVYVNTLASEQYNRLVNEPKYQLIREGPKLSFAASDQKEKQQQIVQKLPLINGLKEASISSVVNGKQTVVNLITKPPVPLLDLTLLEPLTFDNPLVPQVQHFLPRIHQVTYKSLPEVNQVKKHEMVYMVQNTKSYDSELLKDKSKNGSSKKKHKKQPSNKEADDEVEVNHTPNVVTIEESHNESPDVSYEINSPNYKESFSQKKISFKKETESEPVNISYEKKTEMEPVHYSYEKHTESKPLHYSYISNSHKPAQMKQAYYDNNNSNPKHLIYHFKPETIDEEIDEPSSNSESEEATDTSLDERDTKNSRLQRQQHQPQQKQQQQQQQQQRNHPRHELDEEVPANINDQSDDAEEVSYQDSNNDQPEKRHEAPASKGYQQQHKPEHREVYYENSKEDSSDNRESPKPITHNSQVKHVKHQFQPKVQEYEEDIKILPTHQPHTSSHIEHHHNRNSNNRPKPHPSHQIEEGHYDYPASEYTNANEQEKSERVVNKEESPQEIYTPNKEEESEEDFEKAYKDAAYGFPAYDAPLRDTEKEIYSPESYGAAPYIYGFDAEKSPLRQYQAEGDEYPTQTRLKYKDARDKTNGDYFFDYSISRPKSLTDRYNKKADYYKMYDDHKPEKYFAKEDEDKKENAKYTAPTTYEYHIIPQQQNQPLAKYRAPPKPEVQHDNSAFATRPQHKYRSKTQFVEPHYQYGFEPLTIPRLLDSELAAMASNVTPEQEKLGLRKNLFKQKYYIKKTNTPKGGKVGS